MLVKIPGTNLVRDTDSMALINTDTNEQNEYYAKVRLIQNQKQEINTVKNEIQDVRNELQEIKQLMLKLLDKGSNG
jgi:uncharacterized coiled-coil DUF342 family protein